MTTALLNVTTEARAEKPLREIERSAAGLEQENLSNKGRLRVKTIKAAVAQLQQSLGALLGQSGFLPQQTGARVVAELQTAEGGAWTGAELEQLFGLKPATLHRRRKEHRVIFWRDARHEFHYPRWQFTETGALLPGVQGVLQTFDSESSWAVGARWICFVLAKWIKCWLTPEFMPKKTPGKLNSPPPQSEFDRLSMARWCVPARGVFYRLHSMDGATGRPWPPIYFSRAGLTRFSPRCSTMSCSKTPLNRNRGLGRLRLERAGLGEIGFGLRAWLVGFQIWLSMAIALLAAGAEGGASFNFKSSGIVIQEILVDGQSRTLRGKQPPSSKRGAEAGREAAVMDGVRISSRAQLSSMMPASS